MEKCPLMTYETMIKTLTTIESSSTKKEKKKKKKTLTTFFFLLNNFNNSLFSHIGYFIFNLFGTLSSFLYFFPSLISSDHYYVLFIPFFICPLVLLLFLDFSNFLAGSCFWCYCYGKESETICPISLSNRLNQWRQLWWSYSGSKHIN